MTIKMNLTSMLLAVVLLTTIVSGCVNNDTILTQSEDLPPFKSYRDIPGLTEQDLFDIEEVLTRYESFSYAMMLSTEAFYDINGDIRGFSSHFCKYLTELFGIPFIPEIVVFNELLEGLETGLIDFTGTLTPTPERSEVYYMTDPISQRAIKLFRLAGSETAYETLHSRTPRYAMLSRAASTPIILEYAFYDFEPVFIDEYINAYQMLKNGDIDALLAESSVEPIFDTIGDIVTENFFPMVNAFVSFTARRSELAPIVNAVQKLLKNGGARYISNMHDAGHYEYQKYKLSLQLSDDELGYIKNNPVIMFGAEFDNYPISFYDQRSENWQGIAHDVLYEICRLTGLEYIVINEQDATFSELLDMLDAGKIHMISELIITPEREKRYLQPDISFVSDNSVLMSRTDYHNVRLDRVYSERVGLVKNSAHTEFFYSWFPNHPDTVIYEDHYLAMNALANGEVDLVMTSYSTSLYLSNYMEETIYRPSIIFDNYFESSFGISSERELLLSIVNKVLALTDISTISDNWLHKTYDYRLKLAEENNALFRSMIIVMLFVLLLLVALLLRNRYMSKRLEELVASRTQELARSVEEISLARDEAEVANKSKSYFLANMSHEIRTPMNAITGIAQIISLNKELPDEVSEGLEKINNSCDMLMGIINDILDFSKIEAGKLDIIDKEYYVAGAVGDAMQLNMLRIGDKPIIFTVDVDENAPAKLIGDELRIKQIMNNLLSNAFKYTDEGEVKLCVRAEPYANADDEMTNLIITVSDTGCGMTDKQLEKLFEDYTRFYQEVNIAVEGTGLGLSITRRLISLMGGSIDVQSEMGSGSVFTVVLPQGVVDEETIGKENKESLKQLRQGIGRRSNRSIMRDPMPYGHVLTVDDVEANLYVAIGLLKPYKLKIDTAQSGKEAIELIKNGNIYDVIFMDHMMPEMDGVETTDKIRKIGYKEPIVALTANAVAGQSEMFLNSGFNDFVAKPIDIRQLNEVLNKFIRDKQPQEVINSARQQYADEFNDSIEKAHKNHETDKKRIIGSNDYDMGYNSNIEKSQHGTIGNKRINGLDIAKGIEKYDYDEDIYLKILRSYAANARNILDTINSLIPVSNDDIKEYQLKVHSLKGTSLDIYATGTGNEAARLEQMAKDGDIDNINTDTPAFLKTTAKLIDEIDSLLHEINMANPKTVKENLDRDVLIRLREACDYYSMDGVNDAMDEIEKYDYETGGTLVEWLRDKVDIMAFSEIVDELTKYLE